MIEALHRRGKFCAMVCSHPRLFLVSHANLTDW
jgi:hypothetical protein